jgi:hypothetical protein
VARSLEALQIRESPDQNPVGKSKQLMEKAQPLKKSDLVEKIDGEEDAVISGGAVGFRREIKEEGPMEGGVGAMNIECEAGQIFGLVEVRDCWSLYLVQLFEYAGS